MTVLIVDDQPDVVRGEEQGINWTSLGVDRILSAYSVPEAEKLLLSEPVSVLLCDIEMPPRSGLELLELIRERKLPTRCIFLSAHAEFTYAQEAVRLGGFDYILPENLYYSDGTRYVNLSAGVQNMTGKKVYDIVTYPGFSESARCDTLSRIFAAFFERRLRRFLPESGNIYNTIYKYTETDVTAFDAENYQALIKILAGSGNCVSSHVTNDVERDSESGLIYFSDETKTRIKKYFS